MTALKASRRDSSLISLSPVTTSAPPPMFHSICHRVTAAFTSAAIWLPLMFWSHANPRGRREPSMRILSSFRIELGESETYKLDAVRRTLLSSSARVHADHSSQPPHPGTLPKCMASANTHYLFQIQQRGDGPYHTGSLLRCNVGFDATGRPRASFKSHSS